MRASWIGLALAGALLLWGCSSDEGGAAPAPGADDVPDAGGLLFPDGGIPRGGDGGQSGDTSARCTPVCGGKECGDDGCGGSCGKCPDLCNGAEDVPGLCLDGQCVHPCGDLLVEVHYDGDTPFDQLTAYAYEGTSCTGAGHYDPALALKASATVGRARRLP